MALTVRENFNPSGAPFDRNNISQRYGDLRFNLLAAVEGVRPRPYYDSEGLLSIGIGFNLTDLGVLDLVLEQLGVPQAQRGAYGSIIQAGGSITAVTSALDLQFGGTFALNDTQMRNVFDQVAVDKETD